MMRREASGRRYLLLFALLFALIFVRYCVYGFEYWYQLDDYIQYHNYTAAGASVGELVSRLGLFAARPLAGLADICFWQRFFPVMILGAAITSLMYAASACFFGSVFERRLGTGCAFYPVYALLPLGIEGTYWMSAATRIVTGLFFTALALWLFDRWCREGRRRNLALYCICQLAAFGFYEQMMPLSAASVILLAVIARGDGKKRRLCALWPFFAAGIYFAFVGAFPDSALYGAKTGYVLPTTPYYFKTFLPEVLSQFKSAFLGGGVLTFTRGGVRGLRLVVSDRLFLYAAGAVVLCAAYLLLSSRRRESTEHTGAAVIVGILLALAPTAPFFIAETTWFSLRGTVCSFCGIALVADTILRLLFARLKNGSRVISALCAVFALWCCACSVSEIHDYKLTTEKDTSFCTAAAEALRSNGFTEKEGSAAILNVLPTYLTEQNCYYHEHIHGVTESDWALTGALRCISGDLTMPSVTPVKAGEMYAAWNRDAMLPENFDALYIYDGNSAFTRVTLDDGALYDANGEMLARTYEENGIGYLEILF